MSSDVSKGQSVYLSHAYGDVDLVEEVDATLREAGVRTVFQPVTPNVSAFRDRRPLFEASVIVIFFSENALDDELAERERAIAFDRDENPLPLRLIIVRLDDAVPVPLMLNRPYIDGRQSDGATIARKLLAVLQGGQETERFPEGSRDAYARQLEHIGDIANAAIAARDSGRAAGGHR